jgi:hypothetical protein
VKARAKPKRAAKKSIGSKRNRPVRVQTIPLDDRLELAFGLLREGSSQRRAAQTAGISPGRLGLFVRNNKLAKFRNGRWYITDRRVRELIVLTEGEQRLISVRGFRTASLAMRHRAAVHQFLETNDAALLGPFKNVSVADTSKQKHLLETRPNVLYRLANAGNDADMKIYRLI